MAITLVKKGTTDEFSFDGSGSDRINFGNVTLDDTGTPPEIESTPLNVEILATTYLYDNVDLTIQSEQAGVDMKLSLDNSTWFDALTSVQIGDIDATGSDQRVDIYVKAEVANDGTVSAGSITAPDIRLTATENQ